MMKFIRHKGSAGTIQNIHILQNKNTRNKQIQKKTKKLILKTHNKLTYISNCINETINNIVLDIIWSRLTNNHIIMIRQDSKLLCPTKTIIAYLQYNIL